MVNKYAYSPFGGLANMLETVPQPFKFVGQYGIMSEPNGLYYMRARYYDQHTGRFISEDPIGFVGGDVNLYAYVQNNPINLIDPSGLITPNRIPNFGTTDVDFSYLVSHDFLSSTATVAGIASTYLAVSGYGLPASAPFAGVALFATALDQSLNSDNVYIDSTATVVGQVVERFVPQPFGLLTGSAINLTAHAVNSSFNEPPKP